MKQKPYLRDIAALLAGAAFPLSLSPFDVWILGLVSVLVLVLALEGSSVRRGAVRFYLYGVGMYGVGTSWIYVSIHEHGGASVLLSVFLVLLFALSLAIFSFVQGYIYLRYVRPLRYGLAFGFAAVWFLKEWFLTWFLTGFPWLYAGYGQMETWLGGYVPIIGVLGVGLLVAVQGGLLAAALIERNRTSSIISGLVIVVLWIGGLGLSQLTLVKPVRPIEVSLVQGNIDQHIKWTRQMVAQIIGTYEALTQDEWGRDLIVWPEAAVTVFRTGADELIDGWDKKGKASGSTLILGIPDRDSSGQFLNTAIAVGAGEGQYIKRRLVPFGEFVPLEDLLRGIITVFNLPMSHNRPGPWEQAPLTAGGLSVSLSICYEVIYPNLVRTTTDDPDLLVTISNDTWFGDSIGPWQHLQMAQGRAMENGRYLVRSTNSGVTAVIDEKGHAVAILPQFREGVLRATAYVMDGRTPYSTLGDLPLLILVGLGLAALAALRLRHVTSESIR